MCRGSGGRRLEFSIALALFGQKLLPQIVDTSRSKCAVELASKDSLDVAVKWVRTIVREKVVFNFQKMHFIKFSK